MKRTTVVSLVLALFLPVLVWVGVAGAQSFRTGDDSIIHSDETIDSSLWLAGDSIEVAGTVNGDVFCAGMNVSITGRVNGDVMCAGQTVRVAGTVDGDVRLAGQSVSVGERVQGSVTVGAQNFTLERNANIDRDAHIGATTVTLNGSIGRDVALGAERALIAATIGRNVESGADRLRLNDRAQIGGDLNYTSHNKANIASGAQVNGETNRTTPSEDRRDQSGWGLGFMIALYFLLAMLLLALVLVLLLPRMFWRVTDTGVESLLKVFVVGLLASFLYPVIFFMLLLTIIGIPLAFFSLLLWLVILTLSGPFFAFYVGRTLFRQRSALFTMFIGGVIVLVLYLIPVVGLFVLLLSHWIGTGMILTSLWQRRTIKQAENNTAVEEKEISSSKTEATQTNESEPTKRRRTKQS